jgi:hypothetical protein
VVARRDGGCPQERPAAIEGSGVVAVVDPASRHATASVAGVQHGVSTIRFRRPGSGCPAVRCPVTWGRPVGPAVGCLLSTRLLSTRPASSRPVSAASVRTRPDPPMLRRGVGGPGRGGRATVPTGTGGGRAGDGSSDGQGGRDARATLPTSRWLGGGRGDPGRRVGCGPRRPRLPAEQPARPALGAPLAAARWAGEQGCSARWRQPPGGCRPRAGV